MAFRKEYWASYFARQVYDEHIGDFIRSHGNFAPTRIIAYKNSGWNLVRFVDDKYSGYFGASFVKADGSWAIIAHRGTDDSKDFIADMELWYKSKSSGQLSLQIMKGIELFRFTEGLITNSVRILMTGHSLGGSIAEVAGLVAKSEVIVFDSPGAGYFLEGTFGLKKILETKEKTDYKVTAYQADPNCINGLSTTFFDKIYRIQNLFSEEDSSSNTLVYLYRTLVDLHRVDNLAWSIGPSGPFMIEDVTRHWQHYAQDYGRVYSYNCNLNPEACNNLLRRNQNFLSTKEGYFYRQYTNDKYPVGVTIILNKNFIPGISGDEEGAVLESIRNYHHNIWAISGTNYNDQLQSRGKHDNVFHSFAGKDLITDEGGLDKYMINLNPKLIGKNHLYDLKIDDQDGIGVVVFEDFGQGCMLQYGESYRLNNKNSKKLVYLSVLDRKCYPNAAITTGVIVVMEPQDNHQEKVSLYGNSAYLGNIFLDRNLMQGGNSSKPQFGIKLFDDNYAGGIIFCSTDKIATLVNIGGMGLKYVGYAGNQRDCHIINQETGTLVVKKHSTKQFGSIFIHGSIREVDLSEIAYSSEDFVVENFQIICKQFVNIILPEVDVTVRIKTVLEVYEVHLAAQKNSSFMDYFY